MSNQRKEAFLEGYYYSFSCFFFAANFGVFFFWYNVHSIGMAIAQITIFLVCSMSPFIYFKNLAKASSTGSETAKELAQLNMAGFIIGPAIVFVALLIQGIIYMSLVI